MALLRRMGESIKNLSVHLRSYGESGRKLVLITGRLLDDMLGVFPRHDLFEWIVAENGALLYSPGTRESLLIADPVPDGFPESLRARGIDNIGVGRSIVGTWRPHECTVLEVLRDLGLDRQIIFNKNAVMILPTGVNKAFGLAAALQEMKLSSHNVVAIGDAENDLPMLTLCECGVAVANALDSVKAKSNFVTRADHGAGVAELVSELLKDDLASRLPPAQRRGLLLGRAKNGKQQRIYIPSLSSSLLVAGPSGSGKSTAITGLVERMAQAAYQFCLFDPEGDYEGFEPAVNLGNANYVPGANDVLTLVDRMYSLVVNLLGVSLDSRPEYVSEVIRKLEHVRAAEGRPHWFIIDEAHHIFPSDPPSASARLSEPPKTSLLITVHPKHVSKEALTSIDILIAVGKDPHETIKEFCQSAGIDEPRIGPMALERWEVLIWNRHEKAEPFVVVIEPGKLEHKRHIRKYAEGNLGDRSFVFRGPQGRLNLVAHNLDTFMRMGGGVDEETWRYHLDSHHYSQWIRSAIKDQKLADLVEQLEQDNCQDSRTRLFEAIKAKYTTPD